MAANPPNDARPASAASAGCGLLLFGGFSRERSFHGGARSGVAGRGWNQVGTEGLRIGEQRGLRIDQGADQV